MVLLFVRLLLILLLPGVRALVKFCVAVTLSAEKANQNGLAFNVTEQASRSHNF